MSVPNTTYRVLVEKLGDSDPSQFIGNEGEVFYDPNNPELKLSDGTTPGGLSIGGETPTQTVPLFVVVNIDGKTSYSNDGENWSEGARLTFDGNFSEDVSRVSVANNYIIYIENNQLWYAFDVNQNPSLITVPQPSGDIPSPGTYEWVDVHYADGYTVAVGQYTPDSNGIQIPVFAYTTNGTNWILGSIDPLYYEEATLTAFTSVDYGNDGWLIIAASEGESIAGAFFTTNITQTLVVNNFIFFNGLESPNISADSVVWTGDRWWIRIADSAYVYIVSSGANPLTSTWTEVDLEPVAIQSGFISTAFFEDAGGEIDGTYWFMTGSGKGQVIASSDGGQTFVTSVPRPYGGTLTSATQASPCVVVFDDPFFIPNNDGEKVTIANAVPSNYNGSYYVKDDGGYQLYLDSDLQIPFDTTNFDSFVSGEYFLSRGQYIDALGYGLEKFLVGNDDEQLFISTDATTWTLVNDLDNAFEYWNDISFNPTWGKSSGGTVSTGNITFFEERIIGATTAEFGLGVVQVVPNNEGNFFDNGQYVNVYPTISDDAPHIHITAGTLSTTSNYYDEAGNYYYGDLFLGNDSNYFQVKGNGELTINSSAHSGEINFNIGNYGRNRINFDCEGNDLNLYSQGLDFDNDFAIAQPEIDYVGTASTGIIYRSKVYEGECGSMKLLVQCQGDSGGCQLSELLVVRPFGGTTVFINETGRVTGIGTSSHVTFSASYDDGNGRFEVVADTTTDPTNEQWSFRIVPIEINEYQD